MEDVQEDIRFPWEFMEDVKKILKRIKVFISFIFSNVFHEFLSETYVFLNVFHELPREMHVFHSALLESFLIGGNWPTTSEVKGPQYLQPFKAHVHTHKPASRGTAPSEKKARGHLSGRSSFLTFSSTHLHILLSSPSPIILSSSHLLIC